MEAVKFTKATAPRAVVAQVKTKMASDTAKRAKKAPAIPAPIPAATSAEPTSLLSDLHSALYNALALAGPGARLEELLTAHYVSKGCVARTTGSFRGYVTSDKAALNQTYVRYDVKRVSNTDKLEQITLLAFVDDERTIQYDYFPESGVTQRTDITTHYKHLSPSMYCALFCNGDEQVRYFEKVSHSCAMESFGRALLTYDDKTRKARLYKLAREI